MCYILLLSTSFDGDLSVHNTNLLRFSREMPAEPGAAHLLYPHRWYVGSSAGCSCTFRHVLEPERGFGPPEEWCPEEPDQIEATAGFYLVVRGLLDEGYAVDCVDAWNGTAASGIRLRTVTLADAGERGFRFFENHHFVFRNRSRPRGERRRR
jgi:hypothetical protein